MRFSQLIFLNLHLTESITCRNEVICFLSEETDTKL